jgi:flagellar protein FliO/FliZ
MAQYFQVLLAFLFVMGLIGLLSVLLRKFSLESFMVRKNPEMKRNLCVLEILPVDSKRRLVLVKNGSKKHLLLLGINGDLVVESFDEE